MISIENCKLILKDRANNLTDAQIESVRDQLYLIASLVINSTLTSSYPVSEKDK